MSSALKALDWLVVAMMWVGCAAGLLMMLHIAADVFARNVLNDPIDGTIEIVSSYYMVAVAFFPLAYVTRGEGQIYIDLFTRWMPRRTLGLIDTVIYALTTVFLFALAWRSYETAHGKMQQGEVWESAGGYLVVWPSRYVLLTGVLVWAIVTLRLTVAGLLRGADGIDSELHPPLPDPEDDLPERAVE